MKSARKQITALILGLFVIPFSFYELEGPLGLMYFDNSDCSIDLLNKESESKNYSWLFLHNIDIMYQVGQLRTNYEATELCKIFLEGKLENNYYKTSKHNFYFAKNKFKSSMNEDELIKYYENFKTLQFSKVNSSLSLFIEIENNDNNVKICKNGEKVDFETALKDWFSDGKELEYINNAVIKSVQFVKNSEKNQNKDPLFKNSFELSKIADKLNRGIILNEKATKLLENSKILAVYGVFKGDDNKNSMVWGLAENITDPYRKKFHWITDLKDDFSKLIDDGSENDDNKYILCGCLTDYNS